MNRRSIFVSGCDFNSRMFLRCGCSANEKRNFDISAETLLRIASPSSDAVEAIEVNVPERFRASFWIESLDFERASVIA